MTEVKAPESGVCDYKTEHVVTTYTSGNELRGAPVTFGSYDTDRDARQALADAGFSNGEFGWRKGTYTDATITGKMVYSNHRADLHDDLVKAADALADASEDLALSDGVYWKPYVIAALTAYRKARGDTE